jgi:hypothetical protein
MPSESKDTPRIRKTVGVYDKPKGGSLSRAALYAGLIAAVALITGVVAYLN